MTSIFGPGDFNADGFMDVLARQSTDRDHRLISYWRMVLPVAGTRELGVAQCGIEIPNLGSRHSVRSGPAAYGAHRRAAADASGTQDFRPCARPGGRAIGEGMTEFAWPLRTSVLRDPWFRQHPVMALVVAGGLLELFCC